MLNQNNLMQEKKILKIWHKGQIFAPFENFGMVFDTVGIVLTF